jgi:hypothetical protein
VALAVGLFFVLARVPGLRWKAPAVLLISTLPWLAAWQMRNWIETGYSGFSSATEINLYFQVASGIKARVEHRPFLDVRKELGYSDFTGNSGQIYLSQPYLALHPEQAVWTQGQRLAFMHSEALRVIRTHAGLYLSMSVTSLLRTVFFPGERYFDQLLYSGDPSEATNSADDEQRRWVISPSKHGHRVAAERIALAVVLLGLYLLAARGAFRSDMHSPYLWLLLGTVLYILIVTAVGEEPGGNLRYRLPIMPIVCVFAAAGFRRAHSSQMTQPKS